MNADQIRTIHDVIFSGPSGVSGGPHDIRIAASNLVKFQGQGVAAPDGNVYADIDNRQICNEITFNLNDTFSYSFFQHKNFSEQLVLARVQTYIKKASIVSYIVKF